MGKKLAIQGHPTRGNEVIKLLEILGGNNKKFELKGFDVNTYYYIDRDGDIINCYTCDLKRDTFICLTLNEFYEKYPYKVGDKVVYTKYGYNCDDYPVIIESMKWTGTAIEYTFDDCITCLAKDLKMWKGEPDAVISSIYLNSCDYADEVELNLGDYEIEVRDGKTYAVKKKPKYPDNYEECVRIAKNIHGYDIHIDAPAYRGLMESFIKLLICRDAYWKIAGEQMGLNGPWEPKSTEMSYAIVCRDDGDFLLHRRTRAILAFPAEGMRDTFYENFKDLIEQCKELLL